MSYTINPVLLNEPGYQLAALQEKAAQMKADGHVIINATIGDPKDDTPKPIQKEISTFFSQHSYSQYPAPHGNDDLQSAICNWANDEFQGDFNKYRHVISCNGTKEAIFSFPMVLDKSTNPVICIPSLSYPVYESSAKLHGIDHYRLPLTEANKFLPDLQAIPTETLNRTAMFWINSPHNPTTTVASQSYLESLVELAEKHQFIVCADECYNDLYSTDKPASVLSIDSKHWVCFRSLSKRSHMTGYRSGAILSKNEQLIQHLKKLRSPMGVGTPTFIQSAAQWAWSDAAHVEQHRLLYNNKRWRVKQALVAAELSVYGGDAGFYMWVKSANHDTSESLSDWFLDRGILVTPGTVFGSDGNPYVRLVFCLSDTTIAAMCDAIQRPFFQSKGQKN